MGAMLVVFATCCVSVADGVSEEWQQTVLDIVWVGYTPPTSSPDKGIQATPDEIRAGLSVLREAGFTGLVTYGAHRATTRELIKAGKSLGFRGLIIGIWDPASGEEFAVAQEAAKSPIVLGYCVGNEGYGRRYSREVLGRAIADLRRATGKPVTTTEEFDDYSDEALSELGDWIFPNAHPYFHGRLDPAAAVRWTAGAFDDISGRSRRFVWFKEVGLPSTGDSTGQLSESAQEEYYLGLAGTSVHFAYFEAFDQSWKADQSVEPHWGIFNADLSPKLLGKRLLANGPLPRVPGQGDRKTERRPGGHSATGSLEPFYVYMDHGSPKNHFVPAGYMGDCGDVQIDEAFEQQPRSSTSCMQIRYEAKGKGPNTCAYTPPCKWVAVRWQHPPHNWGKTPRWKGEGYNLSGYGQLSFSARADSKCKVKFAVGGLDAPYGDSLTYPRSTLAELAEAWQEFKIDLQGADLRHIVWGFGWETNWDTNPDGVTFYLDDIRFE